MLPGANPFWAPAAAFTAARGFGAGPMLNANAFEAPPPVDELNTSISAMPTFAISAAVICAARSVQNFGFCVMPSGSASTSSRIVLI